MTDARALSHGAKSSSFGDRGVVKRLTALSRLTELTGEHLLDVGCADGTYTMRLADGFQRVDAIDIEEERLADFRRAISGTPFEDRISVHNMSADKLLFDDGTFDAVTTIEVLEHVGDLDASLREIHRVLVPGGRFLITSPNRWFPFETHGVMFRRGGRRHPSWHAPGLPWVPPLHRRMSDARAFTVHRLGARIQRIGFDLVGSGYIMPPFDRSPVGRRIRPLTDAVERSPLQFFGMALVLAFRKR